jgi:hypothetical protein
MQIYRTMRLRLGKADNIHHTVQKKNWKGRKERKDTERQKRAEEKTRRKDKAWLLTAPCQSLHHVMWQGEHVSYPGGTLRERKI